MPQSIRVKRRVSGGTGAPSTLLSGELAWNMADSGTGILYGGKGDDGFGVATSVVALAGSEALPLEGANNVTITEPSNGQALRYNGTVWTNQNDPVVVTSVGLSLPNIFTVSNSPVTSTGTLTGGLANQNANIVFAGPASGSAATPAFRSLIPDDIPTLTAIKISDFNTQVRTNRLNELTVPDSNVSLNSQKLTNVQDPTEAQEGATKNYVDNQLAPIKTNNQGANKIYGGPGEGASAAPTFRNLVPADIPTLTANKISDFNTQVQTNRLDQLTVPSNNLNLNSRKITNLLDPVDPQDAATKAYVDAARQGLDAKDSVRVATTGNIELTGEVTTEIDNVSLVEGNRVLVKNQTVASENGIYVYSSGSWNRAIDADANAKVTAGLFVFVEEGTVNSDSGWVLITDGAINVGVTNISFAQFSGAGQITAGLGLTKTGNTLDIVTANSGRIVVNADSIDLALVEQTDTVGADGLTFVQSITKDNYGRVSGRVIGNVRESSLLQTGVVQLTDSINSASTTTAATPNSVKIAWDLANAALPRSGGVMTGKFNLVNASTSLVSANIGSGAEDPNSLVSGDFWVNSGAIKYYNGSAKKTIAYLDSTITGNAANVTGIVNGVNGGTGVNNGSRTITIGGNLVTTGEFTTTLNVVGNTSLTLPVTGTVATQEWAQPVNTRLTTISGWTADQVTTAGALPTATSGFIAKASATSFSTVGSTGTGSVALSESPTFTGTVTMAAANITGTLTVGTLNIDCGTF